MYIYIRNEVIHEYSESHNPINTPGWGRQNTGTFIVYTRSLPGGLWRKNLPGRCSRRLGGAVQIFRYREVGYPGRLRQTRVERGRWTRRSDELQERCGSLSRDFSAAVGWIFSGGALRFRVSVFFSRNPATRNVCRRDI